MRRCWRTWRGRSNRERCRGGCRSTHPFSNREDPIFELVEGDDVLLDVGSSDDGVLEVALHEANIGKIFTLDNLHAILMQGKRLLEEEGRIQQSP